MENRKQKLETLAKLIKKEQLERLEKNELNCQANRDIYEQINIIEGKKYTKIDVGGSGKYMVDQEGRIFGIKAYGVIHKGHQYGTLDTVNDWFWGNYRAVKRGLA